MEAVHVDDATMRARPFPSIPFVGSTCAYQQDVVKSVTSKGSHKSLECSICLNILLEPVSLPACGHTFCLDCACGLLGEKASRRAAGCPLCRVPIATSVTADSLLPAWTVRAILAEERVHCCWGIKHSGDGELGDSWIPDPQGCTAVLLRSEVDAHIEACVFKFVPCKFFGCSTFVRVRSMSIHNQMNAEAHALCEHNERLRMSEEKEKGQSMVGPLVLLHLVGLDGKQHRMMCFLSESIDDVKGHIQCMLGIKTDLQQLIYAGKHLYGGTLEECGVQKESTLNVTMRLHPGWSFEDLA